MQNSTLRLKGKLFYLLALTILIGSLPSMYGQSDCPEEGDFPTTQDACYLETIGDLQTAGYPVYATDDNDGDTQPIPDDELLNDGETYYVGGTSGDCDRVALTVNVDAAPVPENTIVPGSTNFSISPCSISNFTAEDLASFFTPISGYTIKVYTTEFGNTEATGELTPGESYFVGQTGSGCPSRRAAVGYDPNDPEAPTATSPQEYCEGATVADLMASGTYPNTTAIRWYRNMDANSPLAETVELLDGATYYASQVVNDRNSVFPPCESDERTPVEVTLIPADAGPDNTDNVLCVSEAEVTFADATSTRNYYLSLLTNNSDTNSDNDVPLDGTFDPTIASIRSASGNGTIAGYYETTYTATFDGGCTDDVVLAVNIAEDPYAGEDTEATVCISDFENFLPLNPAFVGVAQGAVMEYIDGTDITPGGTFSPSIADLFNQINEDFTNDAFPQTYTVTYTVENDGCMDMSTLTLNVQSPNDAGEDAEATLCENDAIDQGIFDSEDALRAYYVDLLGAEDTDGSFNPSLESLIANYEDGIDGDSEVFETEYTVDASTECGPSMATASLTVNAADPAQAGTGTSMTYCSTDGEIALTDLLTGDYDMGTFSSPDADVTDGTLNPSEVGAGEYAITYTVSEDTDCVVGTATANFTITVDQAPNAGSDNSETMCETDVEDMDIFENEDNLTAYYLDLLGAEDNDGTFDPSISDLLATYGDGVDADTDFTTTYTVVNSDVCDPASATATLTVINAIPADAGEGTDMTYCSNDAEVTLTDLLTGDFNTGVFSSDNADVTDGMFDPTAEGAGEYEITYTVSPETACVTNTASTTFTITVNQAPNAGPGGDFSFCQAEFMELAVAAAANPQALLDEFDPTITPGGEFTNSNLTQLLAQYAATTSFPATFTTTYTVSNDDCTASADYSVTINPNTEANAGSDQSVTFCTTDGVQDLNASLGADALAGGMFTSDDADVSADGMFDPSTAMAGDYTFTYTVNSDTTPCVDGEDMSTITVTVVEGIDAGDDMSMVICENDLEDDFFTEDNLTAYYLDLLGDDVPTNGTFEPSISDLVDMYNDGMMTGDFSTTYSVGNGTCEDSVTLTVTIRENFNADDLMDIDDVTVCQNAGMQDLTTFLGDNPTFGSFEGYDDGMFDPGMMGPGDYEITYTLSEDTDSCVTGTSSITFTVTVQDSAFAGEGMSATYCNNGSARDLFALLTDGADDDGTFSVDGMTIEDGSFDPMDYAPGTYTVLYTVDAENDCGNDTATFTFTINAAPNAGENFSFSICQNADNLDLMSTLAEGVSTGGSFQFEDNPIPGNTINPSDFEPGEYAIPYVLSNGNCSDLSVLTLIILDAANAGDDMDLTVCMNAEVQNLFDFLSADADTNGEFTYNDAVIADGMMNPADFAAGEYEVTYTVEAINDCGDDMSTFTITVQEAADAPTATDLTFCASDMPTGADLTATGDNLMFYSDAETNTMVMAEDALMAGTYYVTQRTNDEGCESNATSFEVIINDGATPTINNSALSFCEYDDATVLDLTDAIDQTDNITWYDAATGGEMLSTGTALQDGVSYYASYTDPDSGCESSVRLQVTVTIESCPLVFPEGISPNGDGMNDTFTIENIDREYPNYTIEIYNRWGDVVYKGNASTPDWDGTNSQSGSLGDDVLPVGVYFYLLEFNDGATAPRRGKIYLSR